MPDGDGAARGRLAFPLLIITWASTPLFLKHFTHHLDAWTVNGVRYTVAALLWLPFVLLCHRRGELSTDLFRAALYPAASHILAQICWGLAPYYNDASIMHFIGRSTFLFMILLSFLLLHEERRLISRPVFWLGVAGTLAGVVLMYLGGARSGSTSLIGILLLLCTGFGWAAYGVSVKKFMIHYGARISFAVVCLYTAPILLALMAAFGTPTELRHLSAPNWSLIILAAILSTALAHVLLYEVLKQYGPIVSDGVFQIIPFVTVLGAHLFLGEQMTRLQWFGGLVLIGAAYALLLARRQAGR
jgi:drug/metabolite transporter (DMT)-like permease